MISGLTAVFQSDIKKWVADSTTSQLGYICLGCGLGNYSAAVFHLFTHAFFNGLLCLSSEVVIHSIDGVLKTYRLGGLNKLLSIGHGLMVSGSLALVGLLFLAGFYSEGLIIICSFSTYLIRLTLWHFIRGQDWASWNWISQHAVYRSIDLDPGVHRINTAADNEID